MAKNLDTATSFISMLCADGSLPAYEKYCTQGAIYWVAGFGNVQEQLAYLTKLAADNYEDGGLSMEIIGTTEQDDRVAIETVSNGQLRNGLTYNNSYHFLFVFDGDKIAVVKEYCDTKLVSDIWGPIIATQGGH